MTLLDSALTSASSGWGVTDILNGGTAALFLFLAFIGKDIVTAWLQGRRRNGKEKPSATEMLLVSINDNLNKLSDANKKLLSDMEHHHKVWREHAEEAYRDHLEIRAAVNNTEKLVVKIEDRTRKD